MEYVRQNLEFTPAGAYCRAQGLIRAEIRDRTLKLRILLDGMTPAPFGTYQAEMICVKGGSYRRYPLGSVRTDNRGRGELLYRRSLDHTDKGPGPEDFQCFRIQKGKENPTDLLIAKLEQAINWQELPEWGRGVIEQESPEPDPVWMAAPPSEITHEREEKEDVETMAETEEKKGDSIEAEEYLWEHMPEIRPFYRSEWNWIRVDPGDLAPLPVNLTEVENKSLIQSGYTRYKHLILCRGQREYQLGVPYRYIPEMAQEAAKQGFLEFRPAHSQTAKRGDFGYWIEKIPYL